MSKKRKRYSRRHHKIKVCVPNTCLDTHHLCFFRKDWNKGYAKYVRQFHYCMVEIQKGTLHREIHINMGGIPAPHDSAAKEAYKQLIMLDGFGVLHDKDPIEKRLKLLIAIFDCTAQPTADGFKKQLEIVQRYKKEPP